MLRTGRVRPAQPHRQGADGHPGELPARRAVPDPGRRAGADRRGRDVHPRAAPAAAVRAPRHLRPLPLLPGLPAARPLQHDRPRADRRDPQAAARRRVASSSPPGSASPTWPGCTSWSARPRASSSATSTSPSSSAGWSTRPAPGTTTSSAAVTAEYGEEEGSRLSRTYAESFPEAYKEDFPARTAVGRPRPARGDRGRRGHRPVDLRADGRRPRRGPAQGLPDRLAALAEPGAADAQLDGRRGRRRAALRARGPAAAVVHLRLRAALRPGAARRMRGSSSRTRCTRSGTATTRSTASTRWCSAPGSPGGRRPCCAPTRSTCARAARRSRRTTSRTRCATTSTSPGCWCSCSRRGSTRAATSLPADAEARVAKVTEIEERIGPALDDVASLDHDRILRSYLTTSGDAAHQLLPDRRGRPLQVLHLLQARAVGDPRAARAAAEVRDLRLLAAGRGRAPALRARWPAAACAGRTDATTSAPRCSAWSRRRW